MAGEMVKVEPELLTHPKFLLLERELGEYGRDAVKFLLRLWGHCSQNKRGENWGKVTADYVEMVCHWPGKPGQLFCALCKGIMPGRAGFCEVRRGEFIVHEWDTHNSYTVNNWTRAVKDGNHGRTTEEPRKNHGSSVVKPRPNHGLTADKSKDPSKDKSKDPPDLNDMNDMNEVSECTRARAREESPLEPQIPSDKEVIAFGAGGVGIPAVYCQQYHAKKTERHQWLVKTAHGLEVIDWRREIVRYWTTDRATWRAPVLSADERAGQLRELEEKLKTEKNPTKRAELLAHLKKLE